MNEAKMIGGNVGGALGALASVGTIGGQQARDESFTRMRCLELVMGSDLGRHGNAATITTMARDLTAFVTGSKAEA